MVEHGAFAAKLYLACARSSKRALTEEGAYLYLDLVTSQSTIVRAWQEADRAAK